HMSATNVRIRLVMDCGHRRTLTRPNQRWCGSSCRQKAYRQRIKRWREIAGQPAEAHARHEMAMARAREKLEQLSAYMERYRVSGVNVPFREIDSALSGVLAM